MNQNELDKFLWVIGRANALLKEYGLADKGWKFNLSNAKHRVGTCYHNRHLIVYSKHFVRKTHESSIEDTLRHEIAHALVGPDHGHGYVWQMKAIELGANPSWKCDEAVSTAKPNYVIKCPECDRRWTRFRLRKTMHNAYCPECHVQLKIFEVVKGG